jgi:signal peptidase I
VTDGEAAAAGDDVEPPTGPGPADERRGSPLRRILSALVVIGIVVAAVVALRAYVLAPYYIPSASMEPTLHGCPGCENDRVLVDKLSYHLHPVHRGDVVVFDRPSTWVVPDSVLIKRVIGLPGDRLSLRQGQLYVNGLRLAEPYVNRSCPAMRSLRAGRAATLLAPVPLHELWVMGDNRCDSSDSRVFGPVPEQDLVGRALLIIWPVKRLHYL